MSWSSIYFFIEFCFLVPLSVLVGPSVPSSLNTRHLHMAIFSYQMCKDIDKGERVVGMTL